MSLSAFPYPGGKTPYWRKIVRYFPNHRRYIEPFGGGAAVLLNKPPSYLEVFNDLDLDVVHFFRVVREQREELQAWLRAVPFSRSVYEEWQAEYDESIRPDDDVERAGRWFFLRYSNFGGSPDRRAGFKASGKRNEARSFRGGIETLDVVVDRLQEVVIEQQDYSQVIDRYDVRDGQDVALFYLDPPYYAAEQRYYPAAEGFDHREFVKSLADIDGYWICSYDEFPPGMENVAIATREFTARYSLPNAVNEARNESRELLAMNFNPDEAPPFVPAQQTTLAADGGFTSLVDKRGGSE